MTPTVETGREELEAERDHLLRSLDDLELERAAGGIDDESYHALHDDYTARAAAVIRALRDGIDARTSRPASTSGSLLRHPAVVVGVVVLFALAAGLALASALGARLPGQTGSGNSQADGTGAVSAAARARVERLRLAVQAAPQDWTLRAQLADALERANDVSGAIEQWDRAIGVDGTRPEAHANLARLLYLASGSVPNETTRAQLVARAKAGFDKAVEVDPNGRYPDSRYFRAVLLSNAGDLARAQADLQRYLVLAPSGQWSDSARTLLGQVTKALEGTSTTVPPTTTR